RYGQRSATTDADAAAKAAGTIVVDDAVRHRQRSATIAVDAAAIGSEGGRAAGLVANDAAGAECQPSVVKDATTSVVIGRQGIRYGETGHGDVGCEILKHAGSDVAVDRQLSSTRAVDGHVVGNLKFAAGQQDGAGDAGGVNRVAIIRDGARVAQRAGAAVIGVCDYDDGSWQRFARSH